MRLVIVSVSLSWVISAFGVQPPYYFGKLHGVAKSGLFEQSDFDFDGGKVFGCDRYAADVAVAYVCDLEGATVKITSKKGETVSGVFERVRILSRRQATGEWYTEYRFESETYQPLALMLWNWQLTPNDVGGTVWLTDYNVTAGVRAAPVPLPSHSK